MSVDVVAKLNTMPADVPDVKQDPVINLDVKEISIKADRLVIENKNYPITRNYGLKSNTQDLAGDIIGYSLLGSAVCWGVGWVFAGDQSDPKNKREYEELKNNCKGVAILGSITGFTMYMISSVMPNY